MSNPAAQRALELVQRLVLKTSTLKLGGHRQPTRTPLFEGLHHHPKVVA
jgi:hypothetical protein